MNLPWLNPNVVLRPKNRPKKRKPITRNMTKTTRIIFDHDDDFFKEFIFVMMEASAPGRESCRQMA
jgi:hypothetical protein